MRNKCFASEIIKENRKTSLEDELRSIPSKDRFPDVADEKLIDVADEKLKNSIENVLDLDISLSSIRIFRRVKRESKEEDILTFLLKGGFALKFYKKAIKLVIDNLKLEEITLEAKNEALTPNVLASDKKEAVIWLIKKGCYDLTQNQDPEILESDFSESAFLLKDTRRLYSLAKGGELTLERLQGLLKQKAVLNDRILEAFIDSAVKSGFEVEEEEIMKFFLESGEVRINKTSDFFKRNFLEIIVDKIPDEQQSQQHAETTSRATSVAIFFLKNGSGFKIDEARKKKLIKAIIKYDARFILKLLEERKVDKKYLEENFSQEILEIEGLQEEIKNHHVESDRTKAKKQKILERSLFAEIKTVFSTKNLSTEDLPTERKIRSMAAKISSGINTKGDDAEFSKIEVKGKDRIFLHKNRTKIFHKYVADMWRILSGEFVIRDEKLQRDVENPSILVKWDDNLEGNYFLQDKTLLPKESYFEDREFIKRYARMCGVMHVLGERDYNPYNFFVSEKNGKPVKIDHSGFVNDAFAKGFDSDCRVYGSMQSLVFLKFLAGESYKNIVDFVNEGAEKIGDAIRNRQETIQNRAEVYINVYNDKIGEILIKAQEECKKSPELQQYFDEFMIGVKSVIELSEDVEFLTKYEQKYQYEFGEGGAKVAEKCKTLFLENAKKAKETFGRFLPDLTATADFVATEESGAASAEASPSVAPARGEEAAARLGVVDSLGWLTIV